MHPKIKAQLFALGLIGSSKASDAECRAALSGFFGAYGRRVPKKTAAILAGLQGGLGLQEPKHPDEEDELHEDDYEKVEGMDEPEEEDDLEEEDDEVKQQDDPNNPKTQDEPKPEGMDEPEEEDDLEEEDEDEPTNLFPARNVLKAHRREFAEAHHVARRQEKARLADLRAAADLVNSTAGRQAITGEMVLSAFSAGRSTKTAMQAWRKKLSRRGLGTRVSVTGHGSDRFGVDAVNAIFYRSGYGNGNGGSLSDSAASLVNMPMWAIAAQSLQCRGEKVDMYGDKELIAENAMSMGPATRRHVFFSAKEGRQYISAAGAVPDARPGDFPSILSNLANKFLDSIELEAWTYPEYTAVLPGGLRDFKPALMINKSIVDELDVVMDAEQFKDLGLAEEVLSYIFLQRHGGRFQITPVMVANDDLGAFIEGLIGLEEAWQTTQNRKCFELLTANADLLDGNALFSDRGASYGNNDRTSGATPGDSEWAAMEVLFADHKGIGTARRVRGSLDTILVPTGTAEHDAIRTFAPLNVLEPKAAATTANVGIFRGRVKIIAESELRDNSAVIYYGMRSPTKLNTATIVRAYFAGFGEGGRRERWWDPLTKVSNISIEGRIGCAVKNWRYCVRNAGA